MITKINIPDNNSIRFVKRQYNSQPAGSIFTEKQAPFNRQYFNTLYKDEIDWNLNGLINLHGQVFSDYQNYIIQEFRGEAIKTQFRAESDFPLVLNTDVKARVLDANGNEVVCDKSLDLKILNTNYVVKYQYIKFINVGGKVAFYFETGNKKEYDYNSNVITDESFYLNGDLPEFLAVGQSFVFNVSGSIDPNSGSGSYTSIEYNNTVNAFVAVTSRSYVATTNESGTLTTRYTRDTYNVYELTLSNFVDMVCGYIEITTSLDSFVNIWETWETDFIIYNLDINDAAMLFQWESTKDKYLIDFRTGMLNFCYLPVTMYELEPVPDIEVYNNEIGGGKQLDSKYKRNFKLKFTGLPRHLVEKLALIICHNTVYINGKEFVYDGDSWSQEQLNETMLFNISFTVFEPELLGIYSDEYVNTRPSDKQFQLLIDNAGHTQAIDESGNELNI